MSEELVNPFVIKKLSTKIELYPHQMDAELYLNLKKNLKNTLQGGKISVENALDLMQKTIDITEDDIDAVEALSQAVDNDDAIIDKAREIYGLNEVRVYENMLSVNDSVRITAPLDISAETDEGMITKVYPNFNSIPSEDIGYYEVASYHGYSSIHYSPITRYFGRERNIELDNVLGQYSDSKKEKVLRML